MSFIKLIMSIIVRNYQLVTILIYRERGGLAYRYMQLPFSYSIKFSII